MSTFTPAHDHYAWTYELQHRPQARRSIRAAGSFEVPGSDSRLLASVREVTAADIAHYTEVGNRLRNEAIRSAFKRAFAMLFRRQEPVKKA